MNRLKCNPEINISHILLALTFIIWAFAWKGSVETAIKEESHQREAADIEFSAQMKRTAEILKSVQEEQRLNSAHRIRDEERWDD